MNAPCTCAANFNVNKDELYFPIPPRAPAPKAPGRPHVVPPWGRGKSGAGENFAILGPPGVPENRFQAPWLPGLDEIFTGKFPGIFGILKIAIRACSLE